ncbi:MAG: hypothetical protein AB1472_06260 [Candidatus Omnitrophota bacterium]
MGYRILTKRGYDFYEVSSAMQKAIRRGDPDVAGYFAVELFESNYSNYLWERLLIISAEDCWGVITQEILALKTACEMMEKKITKGISRGRIFVAKAIIILCQAKKSRDADHLTNFIVDEGMVDEGKLERYLDEVREQNIDIPEYAFDCHTLKGRRMGKTKTAFWETEFNALYPRQTGLFDNFVIESKN